MLTVKRALAIILLFSMLGSLAAQAAPLGRYSVLNPRIMGGAVSLLKQAGKQLVDPAMYSEAANAFFGVTYDLQPNALKPVLDATYGVTYDMVSWTAQGFCNPSTVLRTSMSQINMGLNTMYDRYGKVVEHILCNTDGVGNSRSVIPSMTLNAAVSAQLALALDTSHTLEQTNVAATLTTSVFKSTQLPNFVVEGGGRLGSLALSSTILISSGIGLATTGAVTLASGGTLDHVITLATPMMTFGAFTMLADNFFLNIPETIAYHEKKGMSEADAIKAFWIARTIHPFMASVPTSAILGSPLEPTLTAALASSYFIATTWSLNKITGHSELFKQRPIAWSLLSAPIKYLRNRALINEVE